MLVSVIKEGLGNQLFQYATGRSLAYKLGVKFKLDICHYETNKSRKYSLNHFGIIEQFITPLEKTSLRAKNWYSKRLKQLDISARSYWYFENGFEFDPKLFQVLDNTIIEGYWQTEKYFKDIEDIIRREFQVKDLLKGKNEEYLREIKKENSVSLHVRRGDYISNDHVNSIHGACGLTYFESAIEYMLKHISNPCFFVFSDDMEWVRENISIKGCRTYYTDHNGDDDFEDLRLMYSCKHQIISNSSFSWWGAWLNSNRNKVVVAPANWFRSNRIDRDILPQSWIRL